MDAGECVALCSIEKSIDESTSQATFWIELVDGIGSQVQAQAAIAFDARNDRLALAGDSPLRPIGKSDSFANQVFTVRFVSRHLASPEPSERAICDRI